MLSRASSYLRKLRLSLGPGGYFAKADRGVTVDAEGSAVVQLFDMTGRPMRAGASTSPTG